MQTLILAAGRGTRLAPLTDTIPKVMAEVAGQPLIERIVRQSVSVGLTDLIIVVGYKQETIRNHLGDGSAYGAKITYVEQTELGGTGHAVSTAAPHLIGDFMFLFGDSLVEAGMIARTRDVLTPGAVGVARVAEPSRYGIVELDNAGCVASIIEKPVEPPTNLAVMAMYKMPFALIDALRGVGKSVRGEIELPDAVRTLIERGVKFSAVDITGVMDIANLDDLATANRISNPVI